MHAALHGLRDHSSPTRMEPALPAVEAQKRGVLTTEPPGKSQIVLFI